jgi:gamma-glutamyltranspeptidase/glutathione hydrolase/leukotriene-C4 hydrolase
MKPQLPRKSSKFITAILVVLSLVIIGGVIAAVALFVYSTTIKNAAIVTNGIECAALGRKIFNRGGNAADAAVTVVLCEGITCPQSAGIGGGFLLSFYSKKDGVVRTLNAREVAPGLATTDMFVNDRNGSTSGGKAVAVPGEIKGLWELHQRHGKLRWKELLQPVIDLCRNGHVVSPYLVNIFARSEERILGEPSLRAIFIDPATNKTFKLGEKVKRVKLAETLEVIAEQGADAIYGGGEIGRMMVEDVVEHGGLLTVQDLKDYE